MSDAKRPTGRPSKRFRIADFDVLDPRARALVLQRCAVATADGSLGTRQAAEVAKLLRAAGEAAREVAERGELEELQRLRDELTETINRHHGAGFGTGGSWGDGGDAQ